MTAANPLMARLCLTQPSAAWYNFYMELQSVRTRAFAKVNLSLNITGRRGDMHTLDSVMMSVDIFDTVTVTERSDGDIRVRFIGNDGIGKDNTAFKAAKAVQTVVGGGWDIVVEKRIPVGAGLGGSSADGAAVLRALDVMYKLPARGADMRKIALSVGSDVPFMLTGGLARVRGVGEEMFFMENKCSLFCVGIMCGQVSTAAAYKRFDEMYDGRFCPTDNDALCERQLDGDAAIELFDNALFAPSSALLPELCSARTKLEGLGARAVMTGSGGMAVGYFTDIASFSACVSALRGENNAYVFAPARTGVLHERLRSA